MVCQIVAPYRNLKIAKCIWCLSLCSPNISLIDFLPSYTILLILRRYSAIWVGCRDSVIQINVFRSLVVLYGAQFLHLLDNFCRRVVFIIFGFCYFFLDLKFFPNSQTQESREFWLCFYIYNLEYLLQVGTHDPAFFSQLRHTLPVFSQ